MSNAVDLFELITVVYGERGRTPGLPAALGFGKRPAQLSQCFLGLGRNSGLLGDSGVVHRPVTDCAGHIVQSSRDHRDAQQPPHVL